MRWNLLIAFGVISLSLVAAFMVACSDSPSCKPGTLLLQVALLDTAPLADTITVVDNDPGAVVTQTFPHTPNQAGAAVGVEHITVEVSWPGGYPADKLVHLLVKATGGVTVLGANTATIHLDPSCTVGSVAVRGGSALVPTDGGTTD